MNIISTGGADAVTIDGINWTLYIHDNFDCPTNDPEEFFHIDMPDIRFGEWSRKSGLRRSPLIASYHYREIQAIGSALLDALEKHADLCPYPFADIYELWLLDSTNKEPLALLDSVCHKHEIHYPENLAWEAGLRCRQEFLREHTLPIAQNVPAGVFLNQLINQRAGKKPSAQWFYRDSSKYGKGLDGVNLEPSLHGREMSARLFPKMLVQTQWQDETNNSLMASFVDWLSPYLLVLDFLRDRQREMLEVAARNHAMLVDKMYPLYPKVINRQVINAARVEAMMRRSTESSVS